MQLVKMRSYSNRWYGEPLMTGVLIMTGVFTRRQRHTDRTSPCEDRHRADRHVTMEVEIEMMHLQVKEFQGLPDTEGGRSKEGVSPPYSQGEWPC